MRHTFLHTGGNATVILTIAISIVLSSGKSTRYNYSRQNFFEARWTGTLTLDEKYVGITGTSTRHVSVTFSNALPTLFRDDETTDLNFTDDKGTGTATYHAEQIIAGRKISVTDCQGSGKSELHEVVVDESENNYEIAAIGPACSGSTVSYIGGPTETYGPEYTDLIISDQPLSANHDVLAGSKSEVIDIGGDLGTVTRTITWNLVKTINRNVELIVIPAAYDTWLPEAGLNGLIKGNEMSLTLKLQAIGGGPTTAKAKAFELKLTNTSREPGVTINYPLVPGDSLPDLRFQVQANAEIDDEFQSLKILCPGGCQTATFKIGSFDGGGYSTLTAIAILQDNNSRIQGKLTGPNGATEITIPKRDPNSNIGKAWLTKYSTPGETDDRETTKDNSNDGDGLTAYEEYRGVISKFKYKKLDPTKKELGVKMKKAEISLFDQGIKLLESAASIVVVPFFEEEIGPERLLNKNHKTANIYDQYVEYLVKGRLPDDAMGENQPTNVTAKVLKNSEKVVIDIDKINSAYQSSVTQLNAANRRFGSNIRMPYTAAEDIANTVAHELGHGLGIDHHGMPSMDPLIPQIPEHSVDIYHVYDSYGLEITTRPLPMSGLMGKKGNDESGDLHCIMAYTSLYQWAFRYNGRDGSLNYYAVPLLAPGRILCKDKTGRGMKIPANLIAMGFSADDNYFGEASNGNCISLMKLK